MGNRTFSGIMLIGSFYFLIWGTTFWILLKGFYTSCIYYILYMSFWRLLFHYWLFFYYLFSIVLILLLSVLIWDPSHSLVVFCSHTICGFHLWTITDSFAVSSFILVYLHSISPSFLVKYTVMLCLYTTERRMVEFKKMYDRSTVEFRYISTLLLQVVQ